MITLTAKNGYVFWSRILGCAVVLFPLSISKVDFRSLINSGLLVSANHSSPAYAAFEDLRENYDADLPVIPENGTKLAAGQPADMRIVQQSPRQKHLVLAGMVVRAPEQAMPVAEQKPVVIASGKAEPVRVAVAPVTDNRGELLPIPKRKEILAREAQQEDWSVPNVSEAAKELAERELAGMQASSAPQVEQRIIPTRAGTPIVVRGTPPASLEVARNEDTAVTPEEERFVANLTQLSPDPGQYRPLWLNGQIEMTGGLAFVGPETQVVVKRIYNGEVQEKGRIWLTEGRFEIHVKRPVGYLVAELSTRDGRVLGRGEMNLLHLTGVPANENKVYDIRLALRPTAEGAVFQTISGYSHDNQKLPVREARVEIQAYADAQKVNDEGMVSEPSLDRASSFVARAVAPKHWASLVVGQAGHPQDIRLFSNSLVEALVNLEMEGLVDRKEALLASIVWGQVKRDNKPVAGAQVEMAGNYKPIYFNDMYLPDRKLTRTGSNGLFAFLKVKSGVQALRVKSAGRMYPAQVFPTEDKHVSYLELDVRDKIVSQFRVFDILDLNKPVSARIKLVGTDNDLPLGKSQYVEYSTAANPFMIEADAGAEYEISRMTLTGAPHLVNVPLVRREWLYNLTNERGVYAIPGRGTIVGFIDDQDFEIELTGYGPHDPMQIVYIDADGKPLNSKTGVAGGGFVIFNAPPGLQTLYIHPTQSRETYAQVVVAEPQYVHVVAWSPSN